MPKTRPVPMPAPLWVRALRPLPLVGRRARSWPAHYVVPSIGRDEGPGGTAGVREPRRPLPAPPSLSVQLDEPVA
jgi:hypothetical protein